MTRRSPYHGLFRFPRDSRGFAVIEMVVVVIVLSVMLGIAIPTYRSAKVHSRNNEMRAHAADIAKALASYNGDYPIRVGMTGVCCDDPMILGRTGTQTDPSNSGFSGPWTSSNYLSLTQGLMSPGGKRYIDDWPRNPYGPTATISVIRSTATSPPASGTPGTIVVLRPPVAAATPRGAFTVVAFGRNIAGAAIKIYQQTTGGDLATDCGYAGHPVCP